MLITTTREMTANERSVLEQAASVGGENPVNRKEFLLGAAFTIGSFLCAVFLFLLVTTQSNQPLLFIGAPVLVIVGIVLFFFGVNMVLSFFRWRSYAKQFRRKGNPKFQEALADGRVEVKRVEAKDVIELEEFEDEGPGWIFDLGDGQCLVLKGQTFYPTNEQSPWPNDQFELVRTSKHGLQVGIFCSGKLLEPSQRISTAEFPEEFIWGEMEATFQGSPAQVVKVLQAR